MGCIASHIYHTHYFYSDENSFKPRICFNSKSNPFCISIFISDIFLSVSLLSFAKLFNTMPIWIPLRPDIRELQTSRLCGHDAIPKLPISLSLLLAFRRLMALHPLSSITWVIILSQHSTSTLPLRSRA